MFQYTADLVFQHWKLFTASIESLDGIKLQFSSVQFSHSVLSNSLWRHEPQHSRPPCPSPTPGVHSNPRPLSRWCYPAISSSIVPLSSCPQSLQASGSFPMSQIFTWGGQSIGVSASASVLPKNTQDWSPLGWTGCSVVSNSLQLYQLQHARLPYPLPIPRAFQTHVHRVSDAIQPSPPLSSPFPTAFNVSQDQDLFQWVGSSLQVAKVLELSFSISPSNEHPGLISFRID